MLILGNQLQEILGDFACSVLNYTNNKIVADHFFSEERYNDFLTGKNCRAGQGLFDSDEVLEFNKLNDNTLVIIQHDNIETARYKYVPIFKATMEYKDIDCDNKKAKKNLTFRIRKSLSDNRINFIDTDKNSLDFYNVEAAKIYLKEKYGTYKLTEWSVYVG
jgi:hypothetical protein